MAPGTIGMVSIIWWPSARQVDRVNVACFFYGLAFVYHCQVSSVVTVVIINIYQLATACIVNATMLHLEICFVQLKWYRHQDHSKTVSLRVCSRNPSLRLVHWCCLFEQMSHRVSRVVSSCCCEKDALLLMTFASGQGK